MISFEKNGVTFNYRVAAVIIHGSSILLHRAEQEDFWSLPGGRVEMMESSPEALAREMREELGVEACIERLVWVVETLFEFNGLHYHEIGLYFLVSLPQNAPMLRGSGPFTGIEEGDSATGPLKLIFQWFPLQSVENMRIYPDSLRLKLKQIPDQIVHIANWV